MGDRDQAITKFDFLEPFEPHRFARGGHLQTVSVKLIRPELDIDTRPDAVAFDVPDDGTPPDTLSGYYFPADKSRDDDDDKPLVIVLHGMGGHALSGYMRSAAERLTQGGYPVVLWNNRGAGGSARNCRRLHHPGYTDDLRHLFRYLSDQRSDWCRGGLMSMAFSLGANLLLRYLGETGEESDLRAAASVSAPIDMEVTSQNLRTGSNRLFDRYLLKKQRDELLRENADIDDQERETIRNVRSVWELDDQFTAKRFGLSGASEYYAKNSAAGVLEQIRTPTLLMHAKDDPVVDDDVFDDHPWREGGPLYPAMVQSGGHTGFYAKDGSRWHETATVNFFDWVLRQSVDC